MYLWSINPIDFYQIWQAFLMISPIAKLIMIIFFLQEEVQSWPVPWELLATDGKEHRCGIYFTELYHLADRALGSPNQASH